MTDLVAVCDTTKLMMETLIEIIKTLNVIETNYNGNGVGQCLSKLKKKKKRIRGLKVVKLVKNIFKNFETRTKGFFFFHAFIN